MRDSQSLYSLRLKKENPKDFLTEIKVLDERIEASKIQLTRDKRILLALTLGISSDPSFHSLIQLWSITPNLTSDQAVSMFREELLRRQAVNVNPKDENPIMTSVLLASRKRKRESNKKQDDDSDIEDLRECDKCGKEGHNEKDCWRDIRCKICKKRGHPKEKCWNRDERREARTNLARASINDITVL